MFTKGYTPWNKGKKCPQLGNHLRGKKLSEEIKKKLSIACLKRKEKDGYINSPETRKKISKAKMGHSVSLETRKKLSKANKGKKPWCAGKRGVFSKETLRKMSESKRGKKASEETKRKKSEALKGRYLGKDSSQWLGGKSFEPYGVEFNRKLKEQIRERDNYRCQQCFRHQSELYYRSGRKYKLHIHHTDYNKKNNNPDNLISLCNSCHAQTNFDREDWTNYFNKEINL